MIVADIIDWSIALVPVLLMALLFAWLDVFKLMSPWEMIACLLLGMVAALIAWPISGRMLDTLPMGYSFYSRFVAPWIEEALKGAGAGGAVPDQPHRLQARRDHLRLRDRRRLFGDREYLLPRPLSRTDDVGVAGARAGHGGDARRDHGDPCRHRP